MSEALRTHEQQEFFSTSSEEVQQALDGAHSLLYKFTADQRFHAALIRDGLDPFDDTHKARYWEVGRTYVDEELQGMRRKYGDSLKLRAFELVAKTPDTIFNTYKLDHLPAGDERRRPTAEAACKFNGLVRDFATHYPTVKPSQLDNALSRAALATIENKRIKQSISGTVRAILMGTQHEIGFGQILRATGRKFRHGSTEEDLHGIDYLVESSYYPNRMVPIDVKAALGDIRQHGQDNGLFAIRGDNKVVMYSMIQPDEFRDSFFIPDDIAAQRAPTVSELIDIAESAHRTHYTVDL